MCETGDYVRDPYGLTNDIAFGLISLTYPFVDVWQRFSSNTSQHLCGFEFVPFEPFFHFFFLSPFIFLGLISPIVNLNPCCPFDELIVICGLSHDFCLLTPDEKGEKDLLNTTVETVGKLCTGTWSPCPDVTKARSAHVTLWPCT